jgi:hypothetical protein
MVAALPASKPASAAPAINAFFDLVIVLIQLLFKVCLSNRRAYDSHLGERFRGIENFVRGSLLTAGRRKSTEMNAHKYFERSFRGITALVAVFACQCCNVRQNTAPIFAQHSVCG